MWRGAALALLLAACTTGAQPGAETTPPPELVVVGLAGGGHELVGSRDGRLVAELPPGPLAVGLSAGGDIAEAYLVTPSPASGGTSIDSLLPTHGYTLSESATQPGAALAAVLAPAPALTSFVGRQTVLVVLGADGGLTGYQHGSRLWTSHGQVPASELRLAGDQVVAGFAGDWRAVDPVSGRLVTDLNLGACRPGPIAAAGPTVFLDCQGSLQPGGAAVPAELPVVFQAGADQVLAFPGGEVWRLHGTRATRSGRGPAWSIPPVASPDGGTLYVATAGGIEAVSAGSASHHRLVGLNGITSLGETRDGNFVYALGGGRLRAYSVATGAAAGSVAVNGATIEQVAGG
jgi:hypothetical protein